MNSVPIPYESRLIRTVRRNQERREMLEQAQRVAKELGVDVPTVLAAQKQVQASPGDLRGIPVIGRGVGGAIRHSRPEDAIKKLARAGR